MQSQEDCGQPARQSDKSHFCLNLMLTSDEQNHIQCWSVLTFICLESLCSCLVIRSLDPAASDRPADLSHFSFCFQNFLNSHPIFFVLLPCPTHQRLPATHVGGHACTDTQNQILCPKNILRKSFTGHS